TSVSSVRVTFDEAVDLASFTTDDVSISGPGGAIAVTGVQVVADSGDREFDVSFAVQTTPGDYQVVLGPDIKDKNGNRMDQERDGVAGAAVLDRRPAHAVAFLIHPVAAFIPAVRPQHALAVAPPRLHAEGPVVYQLAPAGDP